MTTAMTFHALDDVSLDEVREVMLESGGTPSGDLARTWHHNRVVSWTFGAGGTRVSWCGMFQLGEAVLLVEGEPSPCAEAIARLPVIEVDELLAALGPRLPRADRVRAVRRLAAIRAPWSDALATQIERGLDDDNPGVRQSFGHAVLVAGWRDAERILDRLCSRRPELVMVLERLAGEG